MKNRTLLESVKCAIQGLKLAFETEKNYKYYMAIAFLFLILNIVTKSSAIEYCVFILSTTMVFALECTNTAIEYLCNIVHDEYEERIKNVKDISASAVIVAGVGFFISQAVILGSNLW